MTPRRFFSLFPSFILSLSLFLCIKTAANENSATNSAALDVLIRDRAFSHLLHHRTGHPYHVQLSRNLTAVTVTALRLRGADLRFRGASLGPLHLPRGIFTRPYARRTLIVFYDLGNLSASYFAVSEHVLIAPVVACLAYDASNVSFARLEGGIEELSLRRTLDPITITFPVAAEGFSSEAARCVRLGQDGSAHLGGVVMAGMRCAVMGTGHYSVVSEAKEEFLTPQVEPAEKWRRGWCVWMPVGGGIAGLVVAIVAGMAVRRARRKRKMGQMERKADEGETLDSVWVRDSKMPAAAVARTQPAIESETVTLSSFSC